MRRCIGFMRRISVKRLIAFGIVKGLITLGIFLFISISSESGASAELGGPSEIISEEYTFEKLYLDEVPTEWNDSYPFSSREDALEESVP